LTGLRKFDNISALYNNNNKTQQNRHEVTGVPGEFSFWGHHLDMHVAQIWQDAKSNYCIFEILFWGLGHVHQQQE